MSDVPESHSASVSPSSVPISISSTNLSPFLNISPDALVIVNQAGTIVMVNGQAEAAFGYTRSELVGQPLELLLPQRFHAGHATHCERYFSAPRTRPMGVGLHLVARRKDGTEFPVEISLSPLLLDDVLHVIGAIRDMTAQRAAERERLQQLQHIREQAELIDRAHDAILVRDPVGRVISWQPELLANIDPGRIEQVLTNLVGNAIKYSPQGGPVVVTLCAETSTRQVKIGVQDSGIGIPQRQHAQIFGRFMRADNAQAWGISGTGLGLYICRELVELHAGHLWFESEEGAGSTFFLTLPIILEQAVDHDPALD